MNTLQLLQGYLAQAIAEQDTSLHDLIQDYIATYIDNPKATCQHPRVRVSIALQLPTMLPDTTDWTSPAIQNQLAKAKGNVITRLFRP